MFGTVQGEPLSCLFAEETVRFHQAFSTISECIVIDRRLGAHYCIKCSAVPVRRPNLEPILGLHAEGLGICHQRFNPHRGWGCLNRSQFTMKCIEQQLQRRQSLLTVDDGSLLHLAGLPLNLLKHDCPKKMGMVLIMRVPEDPIRNPHNVVP